MSIERNLLPNIQVGVVYLHLNLESHLLGGFSQCFSSKDICRFCHCQYNDLQENILEHNPWTREEYDRIASNVDEEEDTNLAGDEAEHHFTEPVETENDIDDEFFDGEELIPDTYHINEEDDHLEVVASYGLKGKCPFNVLTSFHSTSGFPSGKDYKIIEITIFALPLNLIWHM